MFAILTSLILTLQGGGNIEILPNPIIKTYVTLSNMIVHNVTSIQMVIAIVMILTFHIVHRTL